MSRYRARVPVQDLLDEMIASPDICELLAERMIRQQLQRATDIVCVPAEERSRAWSNIALFATLMADQARFLARRN